MPRHDIIDNRNEKLVDHINRILSSTEAGRFGERGRKGEEPLAQWTRKSYDDMSDS